MNLTNEANEGKEQKVYIVCSHNKFLWIFIVSFAKKNIRLCALTLFFSVFKKLRFCRYPSGDRFRKPSFLYFFLRANISTFTKNEGFSLRYGTKTD